MRSACIPSADLPTCRLLTGAQSYLATAIATIAIAVTAIVRRTLLFLAPLPTVGWLRHHRYHHLPRRLGHWRSPCHRATTVAVAAVTAAATAATAARRRHRSSRHLGRHHHLRPRGAVLAAMAATLPLLPWRAAYNTVRMQQSHR